MFLYRKQCRLQQCIQKLLVVEHVLKHATNVCLCCNGSVAMSRTRFYYCRCYTTDDGRVWSFGNTCLDSTGHVTPSSSDRPQPRVRSI